MNCFLFWPLLEQPVPAYTRKRGGGGGGGGGGRSITYIYTHTLIQCCFPRTLSPPTHTSPILYVPVEPHELFYPLPLTLSSILPSLPRLTLTLAIHSSLVREPTALAIWFHRSAPKLEGLVRRACSKSYRNYPHTSTNIPNLQHILIFLYCAIISHIRLVNLILITYTINNNKKKKKLNSF